MGIYDDLAKLDSSGLPDQARPAAKPAPASSPTPGRNRSLTRQDGGAVVPPRRRTVAPTPRGAVTSLLDGVDVRAWRGAIAESETMGSNFRMTVGEREQVEDLVRELRRRERIRTSMNELARLGLKLLIHDYRVRGKQSVICTVKES